MLKEDFVPVAIDQWYQRQQKDAEGEFYQKIARQGPRNDMNATTQGRYMATPDGTLLGFNNNHDLVGVERLKQLMKKTLEEFEGHRDTEARVIPQGTQDPRFLLTVTPGTLVIRVHAKVLGTSATAHSIFGKAVSRDNLWIQEEEIPQLVAAIRSGGDFPTRISRRLVRFHLIDNTRGEPPRWLNDEIKQLELRVENATGIIRGKVHLKTKSGDRGYQANLLGIANVEGDQITRFDLVAKGDFWGRGRHTGHEPKGKFPLAVSFRIADGKGIGDQLMPWSTKGWPQGYVESEK